MGGTGRGRGAKGVKEGGKGGGNGRKGTGWQGEERSKVGQGKLGRLGGGCWEAGQARRRVDREWVEAGGWGQPRGTSWWWAAQVAWAAWVWGASGRASRGDGDWTHSQQLAGKGKVGGGSKL